MKVLSPRRLCRQLGNISLHSRKLLEFLQKEGRNVAQAKKGDFVTVHYTGRLEDGSIFDTSKNREPLAFKLGEGNVIAGFEQAVEGMEPGDAKQTTIPAAEAYGERREDMVVDIDRSNMPQEVEPEIGQELQLRLENGQVVPVVVTSVEDGAVTIDANHPLAGKALVFDIELVDVA